MPLIIFLSLMLFSVPGQTVNKTNEIQCSTCQTELKKCLADSSTPGQFVGGKSIHKTCQCCDLYKKCITGIECDLSPSICYNTSCSQIDFVGWIAICVAIVVILFVILAIYLFYRFRPKKVEEPLKSTEMSPASSVSQQSAQQIKHKEVKDIQVNYQRLAKVLSSSTTSTSESEEEPAQSQPKLTEVKVAK
ncbi:hypothetical protein EIN_251070 [Entamoeba invadens IP1]|uniref:Uncharacterized protein n=1 Tax=Entamoeba invadens IP1 TaxID=370355 RepID=A0A0A1UEP8_ENTIV|nr:hypothetical protein EIN_251070 [Entamoeba invadens IP1]ELP94963.1 hypothetical protein EIN_251070 [Entamoeba invadens IP1]|eukprot:XP_004261734.1 hypothetical protein EIN_251070 [Entamoeba invadens IP1]